MATAAVPAVAAAAEETAVAAADGVGVRCLWRELEAAGYGGGGGAGGGGGPRCTDGLRAVESDGAALSAFKRRKH